MSEILERIKEKFSKIAKNQKVVYDKGQNDFVKKCCEGTITELVIPDGVTKVKKDTFSEQTSLVSVTMPDSVTEIGDYAFYRCPLPNDISLPANLVSIGSHAFRYSQFSNLNIPSKVESIGGVAFGDNANLTRVFLPKSVTTIGSAAFQNTNIAELHLEDVTACASIDYDSTAYTSNPMYKGGAIYENGLKVSKIELNDNVNPRTFCGVNVEEVVLSDGVKIILDGAFYSGRFKTLTIGSRVSSLYTSAFASCKNLETIYFNATSCAGSSSSAQPFLNCGTETEEGTKVIIGANVTALGNHIFYGNASWGLENVEFAEGSLCTSIGNSTFFYAKFKQINLPSKLQTIGSNAFRYAALTEITLPETIASIGAYAFGNCIWLASITCKATAPPTIQSSSFYNVPSTCPIYVPAEAVDAYKAATNWASRASYIQAIPEE